MSIAHRLRIAASFQVVLFGQWFAFETHPDELATATPDRPSPPAHTDEPLRVETKPLGFRLQGGDGYLIGEPR